MIVLDTDHLSILQFPESPQYERLVAALHESDDGALATTVISLEEQMRGWLAAIHRARTVHDQTRYYARLAGLIDFFSRWQIVGFDEPAAEQLATLRKQGIRVATL